MPSMFTVTGSPVTSTGTLTATLVTQSANKVFAGPASASGSATPLAVVQAAVGNGAEPATCTFSAAPTAGNLVINLFYCIANAPTVGLNGWTTVSQFSAGGSTGSLTLSYRYAQAGDTATYGSPSSDNTDRSNAIQWEISGASATWANALDLYKLESVTAAASNTATSQTTSYTSELVLSGGFDYFNTFPAAPSRRPDGLATRSCQANSTSMAQPGTFSHPLPAPREQ
jgi:hypothetical protein